MKKAIVAAVSMAAVLLATGCAGMWKTLGVETIQAQDERAAAQRQDSDQREAALRAENEGLKAQVAELQATVDRLSLRMDEVERGSADLERIQSLVEALDRRVDLIPEETLRKLADIFARAAEEERADAQEAQPVPAAQ